MSDQTKITPEITLVCATTTPMSWIVEAVNCDGGGGIAVALFSGPEAESCARQWCAFKYEIFHPEVLVT